MPYRYVAYSGNNAIVEGRINAATEAAAEEALLKVGYRPLVLRPMGRKLSLATAFPSLYTVKPRDIIAFAQQMAALLHSGIPLVTALETLRTQFASAAMRSTLSSIIQDVRGGVPLSQAIGAFPNVFPSLYTRMITAGERAGDLEGMLRQMADYYSRELALKKKVKSAMFYPTIVVGMTVVVGSIMVVFVLPKVIVLATTLNVPLPLITRMLLAGSAALVDAKFMIAAGIGSGVVGLNRAQKVPAVRVVLHRLMLKAPVIGKIIVYRELARLSRTMGLLLGSGLPLPDVLDMVTKIVENEAVRKVMRDVRQEVLVGHQLSGPFVKASFVPATFSQMVRTGEMTGSLDTNLRTMADMYETELQEMLQSAVAMIEPIMTIAIGLMVGAMALSVVMPIFSIIGSVSGQTGG